MHLQIGQRYIQEGVILLQPYHESRSFLSGLDDLSRATHACAFIFLVLLSFALRCIGASDIPLKFWDDAYTLQFSVAPFADIYKFIKDQPFDGYVDWQSPLTNYIVAILISLGKSDFSVRMVSIVPGAFAPALVYLTASRLFSRRIGFIAGLLLAVNVFHIEHSQQVRCYSLYLTLSLVSIHGLYVWLEDRSRFWLVAHTVSTTLLLYTSYLSASTIGVELVWLAAVCLKRKTVDGLSFARTILQVWPLIASFCVCLLLYSPWLPNHMAMYTLLKGAKGNPDVAVFERLFLALNEMMSYWSGVMGYPTAGTPALVLAGVGLIAAALVHRPRSLLFALCWLTVSVVIVVGFNREALHAKTRYLLNALPPFIMFTAAGIDALGSVARRALKRPGPVRSMIPAVVTAFAFLWITFFSIEAMPFFFRRDDDRLKDLCFDMSFHRRDIRQAGLWGSDSKWNPDFLQFILGWYLPDAFSEPASEFDRRYRRVFMVTTPASVDELSAMPQAALLGSYGKMHLNTVGLLNSAPLVVWGNTSDGYRYSDLFTALGVYSDAWNMDNLHVDKGRVMLDDRTKQGRLEYAFVVPEGVELGSFEFSFSAAMLDTIAGPPDSSVKVEFLAEGEAPVALGVFALEKAHALGSRASSQPAIVEPVLDITGLVRGRRTFAVRVTLDPGTRLGSLEIRKVSFSGALEGTPTEEPALLSAKHAAANAGIAKWGPDSPSDGAKPFMFDLRSGVRTASPAWNTSDEIEAFMRQFPGARPLASFPASDGSGSIQVFDPYLAGPAAPGVGRVSSIPGMNAGAWIAASGMFLGASGQAAALPGAGWLNYAGDGSASYLFAPVYVPGQPLPSGAAAQGALIQHPNEQCLTCKDSSPCSVTYTFSSATPFTRADIVYYPRWQADVRFRNRLRAMWSPDNVNWQELETCRGWGSNRWEGWQIPRSLVIRPATPVRNIFIRFELSGDGVQLWSSSEHPMRILLSTGVGKDASSIAFSESDAAVNDMGSYRFQLLPGQPSRTAGLLKSF